MPSTSQHRNTCRRFRTGQNALLSRSPKHNCPLLRNFDTIFDIPTVRAQTVLGPPPCAKKLSELQGRKHLNALFHSSIKDPDWFSKSTSEARTNLVYSVLQPLEALKINTARNFTGWWRIGWYRMPDAESWAEHSGLGWFQDLNREVSMRPVRTAQCHFTSGAKPLCQVCFRHCCFRTKIACLDKLSTRYYVYGGLPQMDLDFEEEIRSETKERLNFGNCPPT